MFRKSQKNVIFFFFNVGVQKLINILKANTFVPERSTNSSTMILAVDHCFLVKGKGTVMTGTVIQGTLTLNDVGNIPTQLLQVLAIYRLLPKQVFQHLCPSDFSYDL